MNVRPRLSPTGIVRILLLIVVPGALVVWVVLHFLQQIVNLPEAALKSGDVLVVLGGEWQFRPRLAAELYRAGFAPRVIVSGRGDFRMNTDELIAGGVPQEAISIEPTSASTYENARNTAPLLNDSGAKRVILVTSWFHARRAKACFQYFCPGIEFQVASTPRERENRNYLDRQARQELLKTGFYALRYGIWPF